MTRNILIIDDEEQLRSLLSRVISLEGYKTRQAGTLKEGLQLLSQVDFDIVLCDVKLPDGNGVDFVKQLKEKYPLIEVILLTAYGNIRDGVTAIKNGAFDYITKGNDNDRIIPLLSQAMDTVMRHKKQAIQIRDKSSCTFDDIIGNSQQMQEAVSLARKIAHSDATVLLLGETGTGKEVFANAIHAAGKRAGNAFVAINCSAFSKELLESELFGHKAGAYTGAVKDKKGLVEIADKGTLFLDEIGEMNIDLQARLLRVIENGEFIALGDVKTSKVNVRIIAATNRDLVKAMESGIFREDLYFRLNVFTISLPPLRERAADIPVLARHFLDYYAARENKSSLDMSQEVIRLLQQHNWKGNIRELRNVLERATILTDGNTVLPEHLPYEIQKQDKASGGLTLAEVEKNHIRKVLQYTNGNKTKAAQCLEIGLTTLYRKMDEYQLPK